MSSKVCEMHSDIEQGNTDKKSLRMNTQFISFYEFLYITWLQRPEVVILAMFGGRWTGGLLALLMPKYWRTLKRLPVPPQLSEGELLAEFVLNCSLVCWLTSPSPGHTTARLVIPSALHLRKVGRYAKFYMRS